MRRLYLLIKNNYWASLNRKINRIGLSAVEEVSRISKRGRYINLAGGSPDRRYYPKDDILELYKEVINEFGMNSLGYPGAGGSGELRQAINEWLNEIGVKAGNIIVTSGAQHAIKLLAELLLNEDNQFCTENPTFIETFYPLKFSSEWYFAINMDEQGMIVQELEQKLRRGFKPKLVYIIPTCHNPTGITMISERRKFLAELAEEHDFYVLEDDPYRPIAQKVPEPVFNYNSDRLIYIGSFSKILVPGLRIGFIVTKREEISNKLEILEQMDFSTSTINQLVIAKAIKKGLLRERNKTLPKVYENKMKILIDTLRDNGVYDFIEPSCGFYLLLRVKGKDSKVIMRRLMEKGVLVVPAKQFFVGGGGEDTLRVSIGPSSEEDIKEGGKILAKTIKEIVEQP
jgi:DNA-binding transcriptional MocR family regulator